MNKYWLFREEFYKSFHQWPIMVAFIALGCLSGWVFSYIWPSYHRATMQIYVGFNPYRAYSDTNFLALSKPRYANLDNYLYWQMYQLEGAIFLPDIIQETLDQLRQADDYWMNINTSQFTDMLDAEWRTAGLWSLTARNRDPSHASQAVSTWSELAVKHIKASVEAARDTFMVDNQLQIISQELVDAESRQRDLQNTRTSLLEWTTENLDSQTTQPLHQTERWRILFFTTHLASFSPSWQAIINSQPSADSPSTVYIDWIEKIIPLIDAEIPVLEQQITDLEKESDNLQDEYSAKADNSLGLSPNLEMIETKEIPTKIIRPASNLTLIGGIIGLLTWILCQLVIIGKRVKTSEL